MTKTDKDEMLWLFALPDDDLPPGGQSREAFLIGLAQNDGLDDWQHRWWQDLSPLRKDES